MLIVWQCFKLLLQLWQCFKVVHKSNTQFWKFICWCLRICEHRAIYKLTAVYIVEVSQHCVLFKALGINTKWYHAPYRRAAAVLISLPKAIGRFATISVLDGWYSARSVVSFQATEHWLLLIFYLTLVRRLSCPERLITYQDGVPANGHSSQY